MTTCRIKLLGAVLFFISLCYIFLSYPANAISRGIMVQTKAASGAAKQIPLYSGYYALVVGCADYTEGWSRLPNPVNDAKEVAVTLEQMGWQVDLLENPDWDRLDTALNQIIAGPGKVKDKGVLFWFSGHGHTLEEADGTKLGYIVPVDAPRPTKDEIGFMRRAIDMRQIETVAKRIRSKHVLMVFDSCFSGAIFTMVRTAPSDYIEEKIDAPVREFITAGRENEQVPDRSVFKICFIQGIKHGYADVNRDGYVTGEELGAYLEENVINYSRKAQHPQFGKINNPKLDKGDFVFVLNRSVPESESNTIASELEAEKQRLAEEAAQIAQERQELEKLKALIEQRKKLEAEHRRLEIEKKKVIEATERQEAESQQLESEKSKLAYIPKVVQSAKISLRKEPKILNTGDLKDIYVKYNFFDTERNPAGNFENDFMDNRDGTVTDGVTGLIWQKNGSTRELSRREANSYVNMLNEEKFAGYSDWRLPTIEELASLLTRSTRKDLCIDSVFERKQKKCWSVDSLPRGNMGHSVYRQKDWIVDFANGLITQAQWVRSAGSPAYMSWASYRKNYVNFVRAVRSLE
ncbi:MAG: DUF1566 domain-containing protein [Desulfobacterales bacterium]|jgi:cell division protein FtsL